MDQTNGKGRRGKSWESSKGENIILSIMLQMQWLPLSRQFELSVAVALACREFIADHVPENVTIKWPNDIFINDSKAGGILIENVVKGTLWQWAVIGVGINVNQVEFAETPLNAASFKQITGKNYNVLQLAEELRLLVIKKVQEIRDGNFDKMLVEYNRQLFARNRYVKLKKQNVVFETKIMGVAASGQLITCDAMERRFNFDEVEFKEFL